MTGSRAATAALVSLALAFASDPSSAQSPTSADTPLRYHVDLTTARTQEIEVSLTMPVEPGRTSLDLAMPVWRPGRYVVLDPAGTVRDFVAHDERGEPLEVSKADKSTWRVALGGTSKITVRYKLYANSLGDRTRHADATHAFLSGSTVFVYPVGQRDRALTVELEAPDHWQIASGLETSPSHARTLVAPSYDVLADSPIEIGEQERLEFDVDGIPHEIVIWPTGRLYDGERLERDFAAIVKSQAELFGDMPYERYVFLLHVGAGAGGGTEHLNSTIMQVPRSRLEASLDEGVTQEYRRLLGLVSHEMFHTWNVKQLRPANLAPYDWQNENYSTLFWVAEGTTSYYDDLTLVETELISTKTYLRLLGEAIDGLRKRPGTRAQSLADSSYDAWIKFNRRTPNDVNTTVSFYTKGAIVSLLIDLELRRLTDDERSLDDVMRTLYRNHPLDQGGFTELDLLAALEATASSDWSGFLSRYVHSSDELPLEEAFAHVGLELELVADKKRPDEGAGSDATAGEEEQDSSTELETSEDEPIAQRARLGAQLRDEAGSTKVTAVLSDGPAWAAGLIAGDQIVALDNRRLRASELESRLERYEPGDTVGLHFLRHDDLYHVELTLGSEPAASWKLRTVDDPTPEQKRAWESWVGHPFPDSD